MIIHNDLNKFFAKNPVVSVGMFDGVHIGHMHIVDRLRQIATEIQGETVLITFSPHPRLFFNPHDKNLQLLNSFDEKIELIEKSGLDHLLIIPFTADFANLTSCQFIENILVKKLRISQLIVGYNHRFGKNREGNFQNLEKCASIFNFRIEKLGEIKIENETISSTLIRQTLKSGDLSRAKKYLNYRYFINGTVTDGHKIGRKLGFPTANIKIDDENKLLPENGVYAVEAFLEGKKYFGMLNIGTRPTFSKNEQIKTIEVHIFNFRENIYMKKIKLIFIEKIRNEKRFEDSKQLIVQLEKDRKSVIQILNN
ncbi:MAG: bifunctional riboflavin kinase/FAD synthetase [Bacteroidetes bacterium]|nr:bifunctional riboflavin kinase/FAD synthetase [Bacteroidota bacterium]MBT6686876.1 bifunctional riboflavin kinase/FAD synthetase [Bacteroidota bacterium]MBT7143007.1 bifunctional riboflavin kinase/FAD synthetase [Bacteroidota bacterium]MBT7492662.1 bifunctional riboflavin kinase/FAD synthetase [Bacteroidota bacterium]